MFTLTTTCSVTGLLFLNGSVSSTCLHLAMAILYQLRYQNFDSFIHRFNV